MRLRSGKLLAANSLQTNATTEISNDDCYSQSSKTTKDKATPSKRLKKKSLSSNDIKKCYSRSDVKVESQKKTETGVPSLLCAKSVKKIASVNLQKKKKILSLKNSLIDTSSHNHVTRAKNDTIQHPKNKITELNMMPTNSITHNEKLKKNIKMKEKFESSVFKKPCSKPNSFYQKVSKSLQVMSHDLRNSHSLEDRMFDKVAMNQTFKKKEGGSNTYLQELNTSSVSDRNIFSQDKNHNLPTAVSTSCEISSDLMSSVNKCDTTSFQNEKSSNVACNLNNQNQERADSELSDTVKDLSISGASDKNILDLKMKVDHLEMTLSKVTSDLSDSIKKLSISSVLEKDISNLNHLLQRLTISSVPQKKVSNQNKNLKELSKLADSQQVSCDSDSIVNNSTLSSFPEEPVADSATELSNIIGKFQKYISLNGISHIKENIHLQALVTSFSQVLSDITNSINGMNISLPPDSIPDLNKNDNLLISSFPSKTDSDINDGLQKKSTCSDKNLFCVKNTVQHLLKPLADQSVSCNPVGHLSGSVAVESFNPSFSTSEPSLLSSTAGNLSKSCGDSDSTQPVQPSESKFQQTSMQNIKFSHSLNDNVRVQNHMKDKICESLVKFNSSSQYNFYCSKNYQKCENASQKSGSNVYGSNLYTPDYISLKKKGLRPVIIDGSNVAYGHGQNEYFSYRGLKLCVHFFIRKGHKVTVFLPHHRKVGLSAANRTILEELEKQKIVAYTPSRKFGKEYIQSYDDWYIVQCAAVFGGVIVSNDCFRDLVQKMPVFSNTIKYRLLMYTWVGDLLLFPVDPLGRTGPSLDQFLSF